MSFICKSYLDFLEFYLCKCIELSMYTYFQVIDGLMQADGTIILNVKSMVQLFTHEATRVFHDRLIDSADSLTFHQILSSVLYDRFKVPS